MAQKLVSFQYEIEKGSSGLTSKAGLALYLDLAKVMGLWGSIDRHVKARKGKQGFTDAQVVMSLMLLNLSGGSCVDDLRILEGDEGFCRVLRRAESEVYSRGERREFAARWRKERRRTVPSPSSVFRYLEGFHDEKQEELREKDGVEKAFVPAPNSSLRGLSLVNRDMLYFAGAQGVDEVATLDMDATLIATDKREAKYCYKGFRSYQPLNVWWAEQGLMVHTEFRDGNVPAGYKQLRVFKEALSHLPREVKRVRFRSDTAGYQHDLLKYCASGADPRFGRIEFAVCSDVTPEFKRAVLEVSEEDWRPLRCKAEGREVDTGVEYAEVCFVPNAIGHSKGGVEYRYLATREAIGEPELPGIELQPELPFPTLYMSHRRYKVFGIVTNMDWDGAELIHWLRERCGKSEEAHLVLKNELAGGFMPSKRFGVNAAWWWISVLSHNLNGIMKRHALGGSWIRKRLKAIRFHLINLPGRVLERSRGLKIRLTRWCPLASFLQEIRWRISMLVPCPGG